MKKYRSKVYQVHQFSYPKLILIALAALTTLSTYAQQQFVHTNTRENNSCNSECTVLDIPELNDNPSAIILATPITEKTVVLNPHPIGVYYFQNKWRVFNLDQKSMPLGAKFKVDYVAKPHTNYFRYSVTMQNLEKSGAASIDHPALNNNPDAQFSLIVSWLPNDERGLANRDSVAIQYNRDAGKWYVSNVNKKALFERAGYNIIIAASNTIGNKDPSPAINSAPVNTNSISGPIGSMQMTAWADGAKLPGDNIKQAHLDKCQVFAFEMGASAPASLDSRGRNYEPITIKLLTGLPITASLLNAFVKGQRMEFIIEAYTNSIATGLEGLNYSIKLSDARIISFRQVYEEGVMQQGNTTATFKKHWDEIKIVFKKIELIKGTYMVVDSQ
jgi:Type VI secretion system effector, Hcp